MMGEDCVRIERFANGYTVNIRDPAIVKHNAKPYDKRGGEWKDPWKAFVFKTDTEVITFLTKNLKKAIASPAGDDFGTTFDTLTKTSDNDGDE